MQRFSALVPKEAPRCLLHVQHITESFLADWQAVVDGQCDAWRAPDSNPLNAMASVILLDQFSRNMFRGTPKAFASDAAAMSWTRHLVVSLAASILCPASLAAKRMPACSAAAAAAASQNCSFCPSQL